MDKKIENGVAAMYNVKLGSNMWETLHPPSIGDSASITGFMEHYVTQAHVCCAWALIHAKRISPIVFPYKIEKKKE